MIQALEALNARPDFDRIRFVVNDFLGVTAVDVDREDVLRLIAIQRAAARVNPRVVTATVATHPKALEMLRVAATLPALPYPVSLFAGLDEAWSWIDRQLPLVGTLA